MLFWQCPRTFRTTLIYTSWPHDLIKAKVLSLVNWCFNRVKNVPLYFRQRVFTDANTSPKGTSFVDLNIKIIGSDVHTSIYDKRDDFGFPIVNFHWLSCDVLDSHPMVFTFLSWLDLLGVALAFRISILKLFKLLPN